MEVNQEIVRKYDLPGPRYTSYPPANLFREGFSGDEYLQAIDRSNREGLRGVSLYVHVPFCPHLCYFCGCNTQLGRDTSLIERYFNALLLEIDRVAQRIDPGRPVTQVHWGGGTPNSVDWSLVESVMDRFRSRFRFSEDAEIAMECSPAYLEEADVDRIAGMGFNRISLGIQDFNRKVLDQINRKPSLLPVARLLEKIRDTTIGGINLDFVYGLPGQTLESYLETLETAATLRPDRLVTFSYAHVPWVKGAQKILEKRGIPGPDIKFDMLTQGYELLTRRGYAPIGMDHFALPGDELASALADRQLHRNFQGYCTRKHTGQVYAFGSSAISQLHDAYSQNAKDTGRYMDQLEKGMLPVEKGYRLDAEETVIRHLINQLMCNGQIDFRREAGILGMDSEGLKALTGYTPERFSEMEKDGLVEAEENSLRTHLLGRLLVRVIARELDPRYEKYQKQFSKTI